MNNTTAFAQFALSKEAQQQVTGGNALPRYPVVVTTSNGTLTSSVNTWTVTGTAQPKLW